MLADAMREFSGRHRDIRALFADRFAQVHEWLTERTDVPEERRLLIGACFTHEYSFEAAVCSIRRSSSTPTRRA